MFLLVVWVNQSQSLLDQGIEDGDILLLKRRYFYSDQNVDGRDPVQLNLLYIQVKNGADREIRLVGKEAGKNFTMIFDV